MRIIIDKNRSTKWKIAFCALIFVFGIYIILSLSWASSKECNYDVINGNYVSYREDQTATYSGFTRSVYLTIENASSVSEYRLNSIVLSSFNEKDFLDEMNVGDQIILLVDKDVIKSIEGNGKSYLDFEASLSEYHDNLIVGYCIGCACLLVALIAFSALVTVKKSKKHRKH